jgi:hypothetical protein
LPDALISHQKYQFWYILVCLERKMLPYFMAIWHFWGHV